MKPWVCAEIDDLGVYGGTCAVCGRPGIRYVHWVVTQSGSGFSAGRVCAKRITGQVPPIGKFLGKRLPWAKAMELRPELNAAGTGCANCGARKAAPVAGEKENSL